LLPVILIFLPRAASIRIRVPSRNDAIIGDGACMRNVASGAEPAHGGVLAHALPPPALNRYNHTV